MVRFDAQCLAFISLTFGRTTTNLIPKFHGREAAGYGDRYAWDCSASVSRLMGTGTFAVLLGWCSEPLWEPPFFFGDGCAGPNCMRTCTRGTCMLLVADAGTGWALGQGLKTR